MFAWRLTTLLLVLGCSAAGCGPGTLHIQGEVTLNGDPVAGPGTVAFYPEAGDSRGVIGEILNGKYDIPSAEGPTPGKYSVQITWPKKTGRTVPSLDPGMTQEETVEAIPKQFNSQSQLKVEIDSSHTVHDFHLKTP